MSKIFDNGSDSDVDLKTNNEYAKNYDNWRKKEEIHKLKTKYGDDYMEDPEEESSSSDDDEDGVELTEKVEKDFFKTLSYLKNKDPRVYDQNVRFFEDNTTESKEKKKKKEKPFSIKEYETKVMLEKNGQFSDSDEDHEEKRSHSPTYVEEQQRIKDSFKQALEQVPDNEGEDWGGMLKSRQKTTEEAAKEDEDYKEWLKGQRNKLDDKEAETALKPLKDYWSNPKLDRGEQFLRDYILNKRFLSNEDEDYIPTYEEIVHDSDKDLTEDEEAIEKQEEFEHKYNFRFEEPDQEFIKRYPRTMEQSLRTVDDKRKVKRAETKERKQKEKQEKMQDLKKLQDLKRQEIEEKIQKLKDITGNSDIGFNDADLDGDFDPDAHDRKMHALFNEEFYEVPEGEQKPEFPEIDQYLELENWEKWQGGDGEQEDDEVPHCEDDNFNMDCDYDSKAATQNELLENSKGKKKRKRKSLFAKAVQKSKPAFDPNDKTYEEYLDEYYKLDCEDIIGDMPCRFKYRQVVPNSFGLTIEEILTANDRELNKWCSLKKAVQYRPEHIEKYDQIAFEKKAQNFNLKKKILPSLYSQGGDENELEIKPSQSGFSKINQTKELKGEESVETKQAQKKEKQEQNSNEDEEHKNETKPADAKKQKIKTQPKDAETKTDPAKTPTKNKKKKKNKKKVVVEALEKKTTDVPSKKRKLSESVKNVDNEPKKKFKKNNKKTESGISDARLSAYGINPKKFKNKLKYGKK